MNPDHLIVDEVMTAFGRIREIFAVEHESFIPSVLVLAKGLTNSHLPLTITLIIEEMNSKFPGPSRQGRDGGAT